MFNTSQGKRSTSPKFSPLPLPQSQAYSTVCRNSQQGFATSTSKLPASELDPHLTHTAPAEGELCDLPLQFKSPPLIPPDHKWFSSLVNAFGATAMIQASVCPFAPPRKGDSAAAGRTRLIPGKLSMRPCSANAPHHAHCWHRSLHHLIYRASNLGVLENIVCRLQINLPWFQLWTFSVPAKLPSAGGTSGPLTNSQDVRRPFYSGFVLNQPAALS